MSTQTTIEDIIITLLKTQSPFTNASTAPVLNYDEDTDTVSSRDRVVVRCSEPTPLVPSKKPTSANSVSQADVEIMIKLATANASTLDTWEAGVNAALATSPATAVTVATASFPNGFEFDNANAGTRQGDGAENRERTKVLRVVFRG